MKTKTMKTKTMKTKRLTEYEDLTRQLNVFTKNSKMVFIKRDEITGKRYAIAERLEKGISIKTNFMTYKEMDCFFWGMLAEKNNIINPDN